MTVERVKRQGRDRWAVRIDGDRDAEGRRTRHYVGTFRTRREAEAEEAKALTDLREGSFVKLDRSTLKELAERWLATEMPKTVAEPQQPSYVSLVHKHIIPRIGHIEVRKLTVQDVEDVLNGLQADGYSHSLITKTRQRISQMLDTAVRWRMVAGNVALQARPPRVEERPIEAWSIEELRMFVTAARDDAHWPLWGVLVETGARQSEVLGLTWDDIDTDAGTIRLAEQTIRLVKGTPTLQLRGKTAAARRTVAISSGLVEELKKYRKTWLQRKLAGGAGWNEAGLLFTTQAGTPLSANNLRQQNYKAIIEEAGIPYRKLHGVRVASITALITGGADPKAVATRVGHSSPSVTLGVYTRTSTKEQERMRDTIAALLDIREQAQ